MHYYTRSFRKYFCRTLLKTSKNTATKWEGRHKKSNSLRIYEYFHPVFSRCFVGAKVYPQPPERMINITGFFLLVFISTPHIAAADSDAANNNESLKRFLAPQEGENSIEGSVEELFSKAEDDYSLLDIGKLTASLDVEYSYYGSVSLVSLFLYGRFSIQDITLDSERVISTTVNLDYGISDNINLGLSLPFVVKDNEQENLTTTDIGDTQISLRWQPRPGVVGEVTSLLFFSINAPTGESPYEIKLGEEQATGQGFPSYTLGTTFYKIFDPLVSFGSLSYTHNPGVDDIDQLRTFFINDEAQSGLLKEIEAGDGISATVGLSYAITYSFTLTMQYQHSITQRSTFIWQDASQNIHNAKSATYDAALAKVTAGWKGDDGHYFNLYISRPLTDGQADIMLGISMPLIY